VSRLSENWAGSARVLTLPLLRATILAGQSFTLSNVARDQQQVKVIGEDRDGCFLSTVVNCGDSATWTVTNNSARDCGY